jgi:hypothetical protein
MDQSLTAGGETALTKETTGGQLHRNRATHEECKAP